MCIIMKFYEDTVQILQDLLTHCKKYLSVIIFQK